MRVGGWLWIAAGWVVLIAFSVGLAQIGAYGLGLFAFLPLVMGALTDRTLPAETTRRALLHGAATGAFGCLFFILIGVEGLICMVMAMPLAVPLGMLGSWLAFKVRISGAGGRSAALLLVPFGLGSAAYDVAAVPAVYEVTTSIEIAAPPQTVWQHVIAYTDMPEPAEWLFRTGVGYPRRVRLSGAGVGATRFCDFSTGTFVEPITVWEPSRRLEFDVVTSPAPMREWSPYGDVEPVHLHGYFNSRKGRFVLKALPNGSTLLEGTSWYQHGLEPGAYWRWWSDAIVHRIHRRVLTHLKQLSEA